MPRPQRIDARELGKGTRINRRIIDRPHFNIVRNLMTGDVAVARPRQSCRFTLKRLIELNYEKWPAR
jgi:hypothetical protein